MYLVAASPSIRVGWSIVTDEVFEGGSRSFSSTRCLQCPVIMSKVCSLPRSRGLASGRPEMRTESPARPWPTLVGKPFWAYSDAMASLASSLWI